jgi:hypothetical protein
MDAQATGVQADDFGSNCPSAGTISRLWSPHPVLFVERDPGRAPGHERRRWVFAGRRTSSAIGNEMMTARRRPARATGNGRMKNISAWTATRGSMEMLAARQNERPRRA